MNFNTRNSEGKKLEQKFLIPTLAIMLSLIGCSYVDGVFRILSFDREVHEDDLVCLAEALKSQGFDARYGAGNKTVHYQMKHPEFGHVYYVSLRAFEYVDKKNELIRSSMKIVHAAKYGGSEPNPCEDVKPAAPMLKSIEDRILSVCGLVVTKKPKQEISCR